MTVLKTWLREVRRTSSATWFARLLGENIVRTIPSTSSAGVGAGLDELDGLEHVGEPLERVVLALERDDDALGRHQPVEREQAERGRAVDDDVLVLGARPRRGRRLRRDSRPSSSASSSSAPTRCCEAGTRSRNLSSVLRMASRERHAVEEHLVDGPAPTRRGGCRAPMPAFPCGSTSTRSVRRSAAASEAARLTAVVVLPTPPFWFAMVRMRPCIGGGSSRSALVRSSTPPRPCPQMDPEPFQGGAWPHPGPPCRTWNPSRSAEGQPGAGTSRRSGTAVFHVEHSRRAPSAGTGHPAQRATARAPRGQLELVDAQQPSPCAAAERLQVGSARAPARASPEQPARRRHTARRAGPSGRDRPAPGSPPPREREPSSAGSPAARTASPRTSSSSSAAIAFTKATFFATESQQVTSSRRAQASGMPGSPAPLPMSSSVARPVQRREQHQAVEEVLLGHLGRRGDGGEVHLPVPGQQPVGVALEPRQRRLVDRERQRLDPARAAPRSEDAVHRAALPTCSPGGRWPASTSSGARRGRRPPRRPPARGRAARPRRRSGTPRRTPARSSKERRSTAAEKSRSVPGLRACASQSTLPASGRACPDPARPAAAGRAPRPRCASLTPSAPISARWICRRSRALIGASASTLPVGRTRLGQPLRHRLHGRVALLAEAAHLEVDPLAPLGARVHDAVGQVLHRLDQRRVELHAVALARLERRRRSPRASPSPRPRPARPSAEELLAEGARLLDLLGRLGAAAACSVAPSGLLPLGPAADSRPWRRFSCIRFISCCWPMESRLLTKM